GPAARVGTASPNKSGLPTWTPSGCTAAAYLRDSGSNKKNAGATACNSAAPVANPTPSRITSTDTGPKASSSGACTFNCPGLMNDTAADFPFTRTLTPSSSVGRFPSTKSPSPHNRVVGAKLVPKIETQLPAAIPGSNDAPLTTAVID